LSTLLRWSGHKVVYDTASAILFGVQDASLYGMDRQSLRVLRRWEHRDAIDLDTVDSTDAETLRTLESMRILVPRDRETRPAGRLGPESLPLRTLVLEVAQACNLACRYCYAEGGTYGGTARLMPAETARRAVRYLVEHSGDTRDLTLVLFGGEPLLNVLALRAAVDEANGASRTTGKRFAISLTTNGTLLTPAIARFLKDHKITVTVSVDGPRDIHDENRPRRNGTGSYDRALTGLKLLRAQGIPVAARATLKPSQWHRVVEVFHHLAGLGFREVGIAPASPVNAECIASSEQEGELLSGMARLADEFVELANKQQIMPFSNLLDLLSRLDAGVVRNSSCGAGLGYLALDARGRFFPCHRLVGEQPLVVGNIDGGTVAAELHSCMSVLRAKQPEHCESCWVRGLCAGGCHYDNHLRQSTGLESARGSCQFIKEWMELGIRTYSRLSMVDGSLLSRLLEARAS
jgi:uncharacterized protein